MLANSVAARVEIANERSLREEAERREIAARATATNEHYWRTTSQNQVNEMINIANSNSSKVALLEQEVVSRDEAMARTLTLMRNESEEISGLKSWKSQAEGQLREATDQVSHIKLDLETKSNTFAAADAQYQADANDAERRFQASPFNAERKAQENSDRIEAMMVKQKSDSDSVVLHMKQQYEKLLSEGKALHARFNVSQEECAPREKYNAELRN